jgi:hypothetical protein
MAEKEVGIKITVQDQASAALKGIGTAASVAAKGVAGIGSVGVAAMKTLSAGIATADHASRLLERGFRLVRDVVQGSVEASLRWRDAQDPATKAMEKFADEIDKTQARIGDVFIPIIVGFQKAIEQVLGSTDKWIEKNREVLTSGILEWIKTITNVMLDVFVPATLAVTHAFTGWSVEWNLLKMTFEVIVAGITKGLAYLMKGVSALADVTGLDSLVAAAKRSSEALDVSAAAGMELGSKLLNAAQSSAMKVDALDGKAKNLGETFRKLVTSGIDESTKAMKKFHASGNVKTGRLAEDLKAQQDQAGNMEQWFQDQRAKRLAGEGLMLDRLLERREMFRQKDLAAQEDKAMAEEELAQQSREMWMGVAGTLSQSMGQAIADVIAGTMTLAAATKSMAKTFADTMLEIVTQSIMKAAIGAGANAWWSASAIPVIGPFIAPALAITAIAGVRGLLSQLATGGEVTGGVQGRDSVLASLTPGEVVLNLNEAAQLKSLMRSISQPRPSPNRSALPAFASGGTVAAPPGGQSFGRGNVTVNQSIRVDALDIPSGEQRRRALIRVAREMEELTRDGVLRLQMAGA